MLFTIAHLALLVTQAPAPRFVAQTIDSKIVIGYGVAIGDVDGDGTPDILLADKTQVVWYRNNDWKRFVIAENLTPRDNVCIAARDLDGDGKVEVAVGAQWNPGETTDTSQSGAIFYLIRPKDPTQKWDPVALPHEPTTHRMRWVRLADGKYSLVVLPLHGRGNKNGEGAGVKVIAYQKPDDPRDPWQTVVLDDSLNMTHNFDIWQAQGGKQEGIALGGKQGAVEVAPKDEKWVEKSGARIASVGVQRGVGEIRRGRLGKTPFLAAVEPMHGNELAVYMLGESPNRTLLTDKLAEGHALAVGDLLGNRRQQVVVGWRNPNAEGKVGIRLFDPLDETGTRWQEHVVDDNTMAAEDIALADLDGDARLDIIASGRSTKNLVVYWNRTPGHANPRFAKRRFPIGSAYPALDIQGLNGKIQRPAVPTKGRKALLINFSEG